MRSNTVLDGRFELLSQAGKGGMASVYRAKDLKTERTVAVKVLALEKPFDLARFGREASVLATVNHPNIVHYVAHGQAEGLYYLAQEWVDGETLAVYQRNHGATAQDAVTIATGTAGALGAIHALGVIHRDVKPANIIIASGRTDTVKLVDFGIARAASEAGVLTRTGVMVGTPSYMAPEQAQGIVTIEPPADVWALGCVLFEILTGRMAFTGKTPSAIRAKIVLGEPPPLAQLCPEAPRALVALVNAMLNKVPQMRPADGAAVKELLATMPAITDGPRRKIGTASAPTSATPTKAERGGAAHCFVFLQPVDDPNAPASGPDITRVAENHELEVHPFEDGSVLMVAKSDGKAGAIEAARAAIELRDQQFDGAISVFGQSFSDTVAEAIDRGSELLDRGTMGALFGDIAGSGEPEVQLDELIAELVKDEMPVVPTEDGPVLRFPRSKTGRK
jgi:eukaryotic-like serine/threonine-protein kinase